MSELPDRIYFHISISSLRKYRKMTDYYSILAGMELRKTSQELNLGTLFHLERDEALQI